jgi:hypothetical protein
MKLNKVYRRWIASVLAAVMVCLQLATAAYACPGLGVSPPEQPMMDMPDCHGMTQLDDQHPQLCKAHCDGDKQSVNTAPAVELVAMPQLDALATRLTGWELAAQPASLPAVIEAHSRPPDGTPAVYLTLQVLRN